MDSQEVISLYETVAGITDKMLAAARNGDWEELIALEAHCASHVATLKAGEPPVPLTGTVRERKVQIIQKILSDDREIRNITQPWMENLSSLMSSVGTERKLSHTYGAPR
ncbi:MAG TPA: flagellar protein FliT [Oxalicibacterium sp.]|nr:flagellar protein FliT [Oxalicibacterium sp.]HWU98469.1 flagellar protein FliT [Oxalicibacterium sp.]